jgi:hypothetical protein
VKLHISEFVGRRDVTGARGYFDIAIPDGPLGRTAVFTAPMREIFTVEQDNRV